MKKILFQLFQTDNLDQVNGIMFLLFKENSTFETIEIFDKVKTQMTEKMANRLAKSREDVRLIEGYFSTKNIVPKRETNPVFDEKITKSIY